ncbi:peroxiredoxin [Haloglycomyces albus]|uniref:peroxiredoxin n=1 Tax=Haloglycomyces albus TaxID=526067 RepID=UPI00046D8F08|nr:peroxiredoxin [Haloglycomyces albus]
MTTPPSEGDTVADFTLPDQRGRAQRLSELLVDGPVVLFFYPAAMTPGCTAEACRFRDMNAEFRQAGAHSVGISMDDVARQTEFADTHGFDFPLLSDVEGRVAELFGVLITNADGSTQVTRDTFVIGTDRRVVTHVHDESNMNRHADAALAALR